MHLADGEEEDEEGLEKERVVILALKSLEEGELSDKCFVHLEIGVYSWIGSVAQAQPGSVDREY
jgi:hypothetical protein